MYVRLNDATVHLFELEGSLINIRSYRNNALTQFSCAQVLRPRRGGWMGLILNVSCRDLGCLVLIVLIAFVVTEFSRLMMKERAIYLI